MTTGLNLSGLVLLDIAVSAGYKGDVVFVNTSFHFPETLELWANLQRKYPEPNFITLEPETETGYLFETDPVRCCQINKVSPLDRYLARTRPTALLNARTRESSQTRSSLVLVEDGDPARINPLIEMTRKDLEVYSVEHSIDKHPLYENGFLSMGCWPCTKAVRNGEDPRSGRFAGQGRTECGMWGTIGITR
jgi:phosphoadenosine phosphosulfate reductase